MSYDQIRYALEDLTAGEVLEMLSLEDTEHLISALDNYISENHALVEANLEQNGVV